MRTLWTTVIGTALTLAPLRADASDTTYTDPCIDAVMAANGADTPPGGGILSQEFSEAGTLVMLEDALGQTWRCISYKDGTVGELTRVDGADDGGGAMAGASGSVAQTTPTSTEQRVQFAPGTSGAILDVTLGSGDAATYLLGANEGQFLDVRLETDSPSLFFMIYVPDGDILYESAQAGNAYRGQLYESGDHRVEVFYNGNVGTTARARLTIEIE